jgi:AraC-like DNA-binding protein
LRFSTRVLPEKQRVTTWREEFGRSLVRVDIEPVGESPFHAQATLHALDGFRMLMCSGSPMHYRRGRDLLADGDDSIGFAVNLGPEAHLSHAGETARLRHGDAISIFTDKAAHLVATRHIGMLFPRAMLMRRSRHLDRVAGRVVPRHNEALRLLVSYIRSLHLRRLPTLPGLPDLIVNHVQALAVLALDPEGAAGPAPGAVGAARLAEAFALIAERFAEPGFSVETIARHQNVSPRYLQRLFENAGETFTARVNEMRLQRAFELLRDPRNDRMRVAQLALQAGFSDISHFNRSFRARFGDTPTGVRAVRA